LYFAKWKRWGKFHCAGGSWGICMAEHLAADTKGLKRPNKSTSGPVNLCLAQTTSLPASCEPLSSSNTIQGLLDTVIHFRPCEPLSSSNTIHGLLDPVIYFRPWEPLSSSKTIPGPLETVIHFRPCEPLSSTNTIQGLLDTVIHFRPCKPLSSSNY
jgi:hypothetical protein